MDQTGWTVFANSNGDEAGKAVDGVHRTRWSSEKPQHPGMFFEVDLGKMLSVSGLALSWGIPEGTFLADLKSYGVPGRD